MEEWVQRAKATDEKFAWGRYFVFQRLHREEVKTRLGLGNAPGDWGTLSRVEGREGWEERGLPQ